MDMFSVAPALLRLLQTSCLKAYSQLLWYFYHSFSEFQVSFAGPTLQLGRCTCARAGVGMARGV